jgi:hypothetical protein
MAHDKGFCRAKMRHAPFVVRPWRTAKRANLVVCPTIKTDHFRD